MEKYHRPTIIDIAREAGVSKATVSRVLTHPEIVSEATKIRVQGVIDKYSYIPNLFAQSLNGAPSKMIGLIIDELSNFFFIEIAEGIDSILGPQYYTMHLLSSRWVMERENELVKSLINSCVDGVLLAPVKPDSPAIKTLQNSQIPFIVMNCIPDDETVSYVACDNIKGGTLAAQFINENRPEQVILITGFDDQSKQHRVEGFTATIHNEIPYFHYEAINTFEQGSHLVDQILLPKGLKHKKTTLFVTNDNVAIGVMNRLLECGIKIPEQVSIIGYDDIRLANLCRVPLTTISQSSNLMGSIAARELLNLIDKGNNSCYKYLIEPSLVIRESTQKA
ncbi:MAG TPA: LacI family DNA-binding transcriptional regulator [Sphaerochaeta sp.]|nr:LacI family DNA-binding transcriptional regulator [Sphaerochaeta sp.]